MVKSWKNVERKIADLVNGVRIPVNGRRGEDIGSPLFYPDVKSRVTVPKTYFDIMKKCEQDGYNFIKLKHNNLYYYMWRVGDTLKFLGGTLSIRPTYLLDIIWPQTGFKWLEHISETSPDDKLPCVIMHRPYVQYKDAIVLSEWKRAHDLFYIRP